MLYPNEVILGMSQVRSAGNHVSIETNRLPSPTQWVSNKTMLSYTEGGFMLNCCGASAMEQVGALFESEIQKQNFVYLLFNVLESYQTYYFIASTTQLKEGTLAPFGKVVHVLKELGAREIDATKNRNHGPNHMHMHVWIPEIFSTEASRKYLKFDKHNCRLPLWWSELKEEEQAKLLEDSKPQMEQLAECVGARAQAKAQQKERADKWRAIHLISEGRLTEELNARGWSNPRYPKGGKDNETIRTVGSQPAEISNGTTFPYAWGGGSGTRTV